MKKLMLIVMIGFVAGALVAFLGTPAMAVTGQCANCHTMHNSQGGVEVATGGPFGRLLLDTCIGCHSSGTANEVIASNTPIVNGPSANTDILAGGNFGVLDGGANDADGHNCLGTPDDTDATLGDTPPGYTAGTNPFIGSLSCAGTSGCHGDRSKAGSGDTGGSDYVALDGAHHANASGAITSATAVGNSYRFLKGIHGYEDPTWEDPSTLSATVHNQYKALGRTDETDPVNTISSLCAQCHGDFHNGTGNVGTGSPWLRHPTDFDLGDATGVEYASYGGVGNTYSVVAPVGSEIVTSVLGTVNPGSPGDGTAVVTCISCHRAHAGVDEDLLRWDYSGILAGGGGAGDGTGCFVCHTTKD